VAVTSISPVSRSSADAEVTCLARAIFRPAVSVASEKVVFQSGEVKKLSKSGMISDNESMENLWVAGYKLRRIFGEKLGTVKVMAVYGAGEM